MSRGRPRARSSPASAAPPRPAADGWGIAPGYVDAFGEWRETSEETRRALVAAMGGEPGREGPPEGPEALVARAGSNVALPAAGELVLEDGRVMPVRGALPASVPPGYHDLHAAGRRTPVIVVPDACATPPRRSWGWAAQIYAARSLASWGIGDLADLRRLGEWSARLGAGFVLVNPLHAATPALPRQPSPYYPTSRRFRDPLYLRVEEVPGAADAGVELEPLARAARALVTDRRIDRDHVHRLKEAALTAVFARFRGDPAFDAYRAEQGAALADFATFCVLTERFGPGWRRWPAEYRAPDSPAVEAFRRAEERRVAYHAWLQWLLDVQMARAAAACPVVQDLPIGVDPDGADAWAWQDVLARETSIGAPPDRYVRDGQDWGLPPFVPHRLRARGYEPFIQTIRATLRHAGGLRIDHVMGLFRLFWVPLGLPPARGGYVRYPADDLLGIVALESQRAGAFIVGEDLGTVEEGVRQALAARRVLSYRCMWFEVDPPARFPVLSLAAATTHDLPTIAGLWTGADVAAQEAIGLRPNTAGAAEIRARLAAMTGLAPEAPVEDVIERTHDLLADAASVLVTATLEDALAVAERPNMPGTTTQWPNWSLALPAPLEEIERLPLPLSIAARLGRRRADAAPSRPPDTRPAAGGGHRVAQEPTR